MILLCIFLVAGIIAIISYFAIRYSKSNRNPLMKIKCKEISLGEFDENGSSSSNNNYDKSINKLNRKITKHIKNIYNKLIKKHGFFDYSSKKL